MSRKPHEIRKLFMFDRCKIFAILQAFTSFVGVRMRVHVQNLGLNINTGACYDDVSYSCSLVEHKECMLHK